MKLTLRQAEVLAHIKECGVIDTGYDGSALETLREKGLVSKHHNAGTGSAVYYTWTLSPAGRQFLGTPVAREVRIFGGRGC